MSNKLTQAIALGSTIAIVMHLQPPVLAQYQAVPAAVSACAAQPAICAVVATGAGVWILYYRGQPPVLCSFKRGCHPYRQPSRPREQRMIDDPDAQQEIISDYVWAIDQYDAERQCRDKARRWRNHYQRIELANKWTNKAGKQRYTCFMTAEGEPRYDDRR